MTDPTTSPPAPAKKSRFAAFTRSSSTNHNDDSNTGTHVSKPKAKWNKAIAHHFTKDSSSPFYKADADAPQSGDVGDFLAGGGKPRIDVAVAKRWPGAQGPGNRGESGTSSSLASANAGQHQEDDDDDDDDDDEDDIVVVKIPSERMQLWQQRVNAARPSKGKGLRVGFVKQAAEVIGEGGDEAVGPPSEVGRVRAARPRSVSDRRPVGAEDLRGEGVDGTGELRPGPMRRVQTDLDEGSSPGLTARGGQVVQQRAREEESPVRRPLARTLTGLSEDARSTLPVVYRDAPPRLPEAPKLPEIRHTSWENDEQARRKQVQMRHNEGMTFKRNSSLVHEQRAEQDSFRPLIDEPRLPDVRPTSDHSRETSLEPRLPEKSPASEHSRDHAPESVSAISPQGMSLFADPRYTKRHSQEASPAGRQPQVKPFQKKTKEVPSYMRHVKTSQVPQARQEDAPPPQSTMVSRPKPEASPLSSQYKIPVYNHIGHAGGSSQDHLPAQNFPPPSPMQHIPAPPQEQARSRDPSPGRERLFGGHTLSAEDPRPLYTRPNGSNSSINRFPPSPPKGHSRTTSQNSLTEQVSGLGHHISLSPRFSPQHSEHSNNSYTTTNFSTPAPAPRYHQEDHRPPSSGGLHVPINLPKPTPSPYSRGPSPADYFAPPPQQPRPHLHDPYHPPSSTSSAHHPAPRSPALSHLRNSRDPVRPDSSSSTHSQINTTRNLPPETPSQAGHQAVETFAARVTHMRGVLALTAEKERARDRCTPDDWLRCGLWWFLRGKSGIEKMLQQQRSGAEVVERLTQAHVDVAKALWVFEGPLGGGGDGDGEGGSLVPAVRRLGVLLGGLALLMAKGGVLPPLASLLQGQDNQVWVEYPGFSPEVSAVLRGECGQGGLVLAPDASSEADALAYMPVEEGGETLICGRYWVGVAVCVDGAESAAGDVSLPCILTLVRERGEFQTGFVLASQRDLVNVRVVPHARDGGAEGKGLTWHSVFWKAGACALLVRLVRGFEITVKLQERDFRALWALSEHCRRVDRSLREANTERLVHKARLAELQYADPTNSTGFPNDKIKACTARVFELSEEVNDGNGVRSVHQGYRLLLYTDPTHRNLYSVSHQLCQNSPLYFEFLSDSSANGTMAMVLRIRKESSETRALLVFPSDNERQNFYNTLNGLSVANDEMIVGKVALTNMTIEPAVPQASTTDPSYTTALSTLQWQKLGITNLAPPHAHSQPPQTIQSPSLRILARHSAGCISDRLNLSIGALLLRLPPATRAPVLQILRAPQADLTLSVDTRHTPPPVAAALHRLHSSVKSTATVRTFCFATLGDLHVFQEALTSQKVVFDGLAASFAISRRRMVVPIYKLWTANFARVQIVRSSTGSGGNGVGTTRVLVFFDEAFRHADAMTFQVKSTDSFELIKGDREGRGCGIRLVDAKFALPSAAAAGEKEREKGSEGDAGGFERVKRRFVNLEGLEYLGEHDDITAAFETEEERDRFVAALPAPPTAGRLLTLKRRI